MSRSLGPRSVQKVQRYSSVGSRRSPEVWSQEKSCDIGVRNGEMTFNATSVRFPPSVVEAQIS
jgi:hypothetical protein